VQGLMTVKEDSKIHSSAFQWNEAKNLSNIYIVSI
jgi:hypothetical protein